MTTIAGELRIGGTVFQAGDSLADIQDAIDRLEQEIKQLRAEVDFIHHGHLEQESVSPPRLEGDDADEHDIPFNDPDDEPENADDEKPHKAQRRKVASRQLKRNR